MRLILFAITPIELYASREQFVIHYKLSLIERFVLDQAIENIHRYDELKSNFYV